MQRRSHFKRFVALAHSCLLLVLGSFSAYGQELSTANLQTSHRVNYSTFIPSEAVAVGSLHLCYAKHRGQRETYACQNVNAGTGMYRIYFKGGRKPKALAWIHGNNITDKLLWQKTKTPEAPAYKLAAPANIPAGSIFIGAGVCQDINDQQIPCTVFRDKPPRTRTFSDYMVFYDPDGKGPTQSKIIYTGVNQDAIPAELEFQIGLSLLKTHCCKQRGLKYIEKAYRLFPLFELYRTAYYRYKAQLSDNGPRQLTFN